MFEKNESWNFASPTGAEIFSQSLLFWQRAGYMVSPTTPQTFQGRSFESRLGIHRLVEVAVFPNGTGATVQVRYRASVTEEGLVVGAVIAVLSLPAIAVGGAISWHEYEQDWNAVRSGYWSFLTQTVRAQPAAPSALGFPPPPPPIPPPPPPLSSETPR